MFPTVIFITQWGMDTIFDTSYDAFRLVRTLYYTLENFWSNLFSTGGKISIIVVYPSCAVYFFYQKCFMLFHRRIHTRDAYFLHYSSLGGVFKPWLLCVAPVRAGWSSYSRGITHGIGYLEYPPFAWSFRSLLVKNFQREIALGGLLTQHIHHSRERHVTGGGDHDGGFLQLDLGVGVLEVVALRHITAQLVDRVHQLLAVEITDDIKAVGVGHKWRQRQGISPA